MFENALTIRSIPTARKIAYKTIVSAVLIAAAVILPQIVHLALGQPGGVKWLPMYLPVVIGGCLLGTKWGLAVGTLSPLISFMVTSLTGDPMPAAERLPFMIAELAVFAAVSGIFTGRISANALWALPAVLSAQLAGRAVFLGLAAVFQSVVPFTVSMIWDQIMSGMPGLIVQAVSASLIVTGLRRLLLQGSN